MAKQYGDTMNRGDNADPSVGAPFTWTVVSGTWELKSNALHDTAVASVTSDSIRAGVDADTTDQFCTVVVSGVVNNAVDEIDCSPCVRFDNTVQTYYKAYWRWTPGSTPGGLRIAKMVAGTQTALGNSGLTVAPLTNGNSARIEAVGSTLRCYYNGTLIDQITDTSITTGTKGGTDNFRGGAGADSSCDSWTFGDYVVAVPIPGRSPSIRGPRGMRNRSTPFALRGNSTLSGGTDYTQTITDSIGIIDTVVQASAAAQTITDAIGITDSLVQTAVYVQSITDAVGITDALSQVAAYVQSITDLIGITDSLSQVAAYVQSVTEAIGITDSLSQIVTYARSLTDSIGITDSISQAAAYSQSVGDSIGVTDSSSQTGGYAQTPLDVIGLTDLLSQAAAYNQTVGDSIGVTDPSSSTNGTAATATDNIGVTDPLTQASVVIQTVLDQLGLTDSLTQASTFVQTVGDSIGETDPLTATNGTSATVADLVGIADPLTQAATYLQTLLEQLGITDTESALVGLGPIPGQGRAYASASAARAGASATTGRAGASAAGGQATATRKITGSVTVSASKPQVGIGD